MTAILGLLLGLFSGVMTGSFSLPMKKTTRWSWEATWLVWSICALLICPWLISFATVPDVLAIFSNANVSDIILVFVFGLCWGVGAIFFELVIENAGRVVDGFGAVDVAESAEGALGIFVHPAADGEESVAPADGEGDAGRFRGIDRGKGGAEGVAG